MENLVQSIKKLRIVLPILFVLLSGGALALLPSLKVETDFLNFLPKSDADLAFFKETGRIFGGNYICLVVVKSKDVFDAKVLSKIQHLSRSYKQIEGVDQVMDLTNMMDIRKTQDGIAVVDLLPDGVVPTQDRELQELRAYALSKEMYTTTFVSKNATTATLVVRLQESADVNAVAASLRLTTEEIWGQDNAYFAGFPMVMEHLVRVIWRDMSVLTSLVAAVILLVLFVSFRLPRGVVLPLLTVTIATLLAFAAMSLANNPVTLISAILPVVLFSTGTAYTIHLLNAVHQEYRQDQDRWGAIKRAMSKVGLAIALSGVTTLVGFLSLLSSPLLLFADFGVYAALGVGLALLISLTLIPALISFLKPTAARSQKRSHRFEAICSALAGMLLKHRWPILICAVLCAGLASLGIGKLRTEMDVLSFFGEESEPRIAEEIVKTEFGGSTPLSIHVSGDIKDPRVLREVYRFQKYLLALENVSQPASVADLIAEMNDKLNDRRAIPASRQGIASLWLLLEGQEALSQMINKSQDRAMIQGRLQVIETTKRNLVVEQINQLIEDKLRTQLIQIPWQQLEAPARKTLARWAAQEIVDNIRLDLQGKNVAWSQNEAFAQQLQTTLGRPPKPVTPKQAATLGHDYFHSEDCDLELEPAVAEQLAQASTKLRTFAEEDFYGAISGTAPHLLEEDEEGVAIAAETLHRIYREAAAKAQVELLFAAIQQQVSPDDLTPQLAQQLRGDLWQSTEPFWLVTPEQFQQLQQSPPEESQIVSLALRQTGLPTVQKKLDLQLQQSQVVSLVIALVTVLLLLIVQLRSLVGGLISIVPIVFTIVVNFGIMSLFGFTINPATMMIAALAIGIGIDYTIHIVTRLRNELASNADERAALEETLRTSGKAVIINVASVALGFIVLMASQLTVIQHFGMLTALSMFLSALGAMTLIPTLVFTVRPSFIFGRMQQ